MFLTNTKRMPSFGVIIKERKYIYMNWKLIFITIDIFGRSGVKKTGKIIEFQNVFCIECLTLIVF